MAGAKADAAKRSAARAVDTVAQMVEYIGGSRVDDYAPLFALNSRLCEMELTGSESASEGGCDHLCTLLVCSSIPYLSTAERAVA